MRFNSKLPESMTQLADLMGLDKEEVQAWPYFKEVRNLFKDYNLNVLEKNDLIKKMGEIADKCKTEDLTLYVDGIATAIAKIKLSY